MGICLAPRCYPCLCSSQWRHRMWRNHRDRPDDPRTPERETERLARDEYERPRYGSAPHDHGPSSQTEWPAHGRHEYGDGQQSGRNGANVEHILVHDLMIRRMASVDPATSVQD